MFHCYHSMASVYRLQDLRNGSTNKTVGKYNFLGTSWHDVHCVFSVTGRRLQNNEHRCRCHYYLSVNFYAATVDQNQLHTVNQKLVSARPTTDRPRSSNTEGDKIRRKVEVHWTEINAKRRDSNGAGKTSCSQSFSETREESFKHGVQRDKCWLESSKKKTTGIYFIEVIDTRDDWWIRIKLVLCW